MRADGRDHDSGDVGVDHGGSRRHGVRCAARGRGHDQTWRETAGEGINDKDKYLNSCHIMKDKNFKPNK